jgi:hypothetical protein
MNTMRNICKVIVLSYLFFASNLSVGQTKSTKVADTAELSMYKKIDVYLRSLSDTLTVKKYDVIIFLSDCSCPSCGKSFSNFICQQILNEKRMLIILNAKGKQFSTFPYLSDTVKNVVTDYSNDFFRLNIATERTSVIVLNENSIKGIYPVNQETLPEQMALLAKIKFRKK